MSDDVPNWYVNQKGKAVGPFKLHDLKSLSAGGRLKGHDLVFKEGSPDWRKAYDWPELASECFGEENLSSFDRLLQTPEEGRAVENQWVLLVREDMDREVRFRQRGPFSTEDVKRQLVEEKIKPSDHAWRKGDGGWRPLYELAEFKAHDLKMTPAAREVLREVADMPRSEEVALPSFSEMQTKSVVSESVPLFFAVESVPVGVKEEPKAHSAPQDTQEVRREPPPAPSPESQLEDFPPLIIHAKPARTPTSAKSKPKSEAPASAPVPVKKTNSSFFDRAMPLFVISLFGVFGVGIWATLNTDRSAFQKQSLSMSSNISPPSVGEVVAPVPPVNMPALEPSAAPVDPPPVPVVSKPLVDRREAGQAVGEPLSAITDYDGKNPIVRVSTDGESLEIIAPFRKGDLLRVRLEGRAGQILDLPALAQKFEFRAGVDQIHSLRLSDFKIPRGEYMVSVQYGMNRFSRGVGLGKDSADYNNELKLHRKMIAYDQQQERKRLISATRELGGILAKAEAQVRDGGAMNTILRDLDKKIPHEIRMVRLNRHELMFSNHWEKLAGQWEKTQQALKQSHPNRNPASVPDLMRARKATSSLENEVRNSSFWD